MKYNNKKIVAIVLLVSGVNYNFAGPAIDRKAQQINTMFINQSSSVVAGKENPTHSDELKSFLNDDKIMQKLQKINIEGSTETTLEVTDFEERIAAALKNKENSLAVQRDRCFYKQVGYGILAGGGLLAAVVAINTSNNSVNKSANAVIAGVGAFAAVGGGVGLSMMSGEKGRIEKHITQVQIMEKDWNQYFEVPNQK